MIRRRFSLMPFDALMPSFGALIATLFDDDATAYYFRFLLICHSLPLMPINRVFF